MEPQDINERRWKLYKVMDFPNPSVIPIPSFSHSIPRNTKGCLVIPKRIFYMVPQDNQALTFHTPLFNLIEARHKRDGLSQNGYSACDTSSSANGRIVSLFYIEDITICEGCSELNTERKEPYCTKECSLTQEGEKTRRRIGAVPKCILEDEIHLGRKRLMRMDPRNIPLEYLASLFEALKLRKDRDIIEVVYQKSPFSEARFEILYPK